MNLKSTARQFIFSEQTHILPEGYSRFPIVNPEYSPLKVEITPNPMPESDHIFALLWDIDKEHNLSATILPSEVPFTFKKSLEPGMRTQMHTHEYMELFYIIDGEYRQNILGKEYTFKRGEVCLIDRNCQHQEILTGSNTMVLFCGITNVMINSIRKEPVITDHISSFLSYALQDRKNVQQYLHFKPLPGGRQTLEKVLDELLCELKKHDAASHYIVKGLLIRIFSILSTGYDSSLSKNQKSRQNYRLFEQITAYMEKNMATVTIKELQEAFHFQEDYFNRLMKLHTGLTYTEYLQSIRLRHAENLLLATSYSIDQIAEMVGYHNKGYFYKIFVEKYGVTPAKLRKSN